MSSSSCLLGPWSPIVSSRYTEIMAIVVPSPTETRRAKKRCGDPSQGWRYLAEPSSVEETMATPDETAVAASPVLRTPEAAS
eukprot:1097172-Pyramimonas_sp.AAC.1